jgi:hypothetical protein
MVQILDKYGNSSIDNGKVVVLDKYGKVKSFSSGGGSGTVTSFSSGNLSPLFNTSVATPTTTPALSFSQISQAQNLFFASPNGSSGVPTFRAIVAADLPSLSSTYVPVTRNITINGTTFDLSADRTWNVGTVTSVAALTLGTTGTDLNSSVANSTTTPVITLNVPTASATNRGALSSADWTTFNNKQDALVSGTNIRTIDDLAILGSGDLEYISNLIYRQGLSYVMNNVNVATYLTFRTNTSIGQSGQSAVSATPPRIAYTSAGTTGSLAFQRGTAGGVAGSSWWWSRKFEITCNIADSRFVCGISNQFQLSPPTNVEPNTLINIAGVCKLSTSNNLHFFHNDGTGLATTVDLGVNYPANNVTVYTYLLELEQDGTSTISFKLTRTDASGNKISTTYTTNTNYAGLVSAIIYGTNNATLSAYSFNDYGVLIKNREAQWTTL